jgi:hypothetical protein
VEVAAGQHLPEGYGPAPFLPSFRSTDLGFGDRLRFVRWRLLFRRQFLQDRLHRLFTGLEFYPRVSDYTFRARYRQRAHVQYLVLPNEAG